MNWWLLLLNGAIGAGPLMDAFDQAYSFLTAHEPGHTVPYQLGGMTRGIIGRGAGRALDNLENRRRWNNMLVMKNLDSVTNAADVMKQSIGQTYVGSGLMGARESLRQIVAPLGPPPPHAAANPAGFF